MVVLVAADFDLAGLEGEIAEFQREFVGDVGIGRHRAAPGALHRQVLPQALDLGDRLPLFAMPADSAADFLATLEAQNRRHRLDLVIPGQFELAIIDDGTSAAREDGIVLRDDRDVARRGQLTQNRLDHDARGAIALDDHGEAVR